MKGRPFLFLVLALILALLQVAVSQDVKIDVTSDTQDRSGGYKVQWDSVHDGLILYRDMTVSALPAARIVGKEGSSVAIYPLKDIPEAQAISIWAAAATPDRGAVLAGILEYGPHNTRPPLKNVVLTYDGAGNLKKVWAVAPYHHHGIAVDSAGNIFGIGVRNDKNSDYPLVVKYSPGGSVVREFLSSNLFPMQDRVLQGSSRDGDPNIFIRGKQLFVWLPATQELFRFSLDGDLESRVSLTSTFQKLAEQMGYGRVRVVSIAATKEDELAAQVQLWPKEADLGKLSVKLGMARIPADASRVSFIGAVSDVPSPGRFVGATSTGKLAFLEFQGNGVGIVKQY